MHARSQPSEPSLYVLDGGVGVDDEVPLNIAVQATPLFKHRLDEVLGIEARVDEMCLGLCLEFANADGEDEEVGLVLGLATRPSHFHRCRLAPDDRIECDDRDFHILGRNLDLHGSHSRRPGLRADFKASAWAALYLRFDLDRIQRRGWRCDHVRQADMRLAGIQSSVWRVNDLDRGG
jgi:hypothetical protein